MNKLLSKYDVIGRPDDVEPILRIVNNYPQFKRDSKSPDFYVLVGGDGTITWKENKWKLYSIPNIPILHVHYRQDSVKTLGFAADVDLNNLPAALDDIIDQKYFLEEEKLIDCIINDERKDTAINDIVIQHENRFCTLLFDAVIDTGNYKIPLPKQRLPSPKCDMFLVSTPYGSTAWNLSAGGPIHVYDTACMGINITHTPIKHEHYICKLEYVLNVKVFCDALVGVDGASSIYRVKEGDQISITQSDRHITIIRTKNTAEPLVSKIRRQIRFSEESIVKSG
jgi:NAD+ kinase